MGSGPSPCRESSYPLEKNKTGARDVIIVRNWAKLAELTAKIETTEGAEARIFAWEHKHLSKIFSQMKHKLGQIQLLTLDLIQQQASLSEIVDLSPINDKSPSPIPSNSRVNPQESKKPSSRSITMGAVARFQGRLYDFRHTAITRLYLTNIPDQVIRKMVGWTPNSGMPRVYVHISTTNMIEAVLHQQPFSSSWSSMSATGSPASRIPPISQNQGQLYGIPRYTR